MLTAFWILFILGMLTIVLSFIMAPESNSFSGALVGSSDLDLFKQTKERGVKKFQKYAMFALGFSMMIVSIIVRVLT